MKDGIHPSGYVPRKPKKQTNADRIRSMSDEELAEFLENFENNSGIECEGEKSYLDWLQSEAEE